VELTERIYDRYWSVEEMGDAEKTEAFISMLEASVNPIISNFDKSKLKKKLIIKFKWMKFHLLCIYFYSKFIFL
jgi:hypothetical protein